MKQLLFLVLILPIMALGDVFETNHISDIIPYVNSKTWVVFGIDNTLIESSVDLGSIEWINHIKKKSEDAGYDETQTEWLLAKFWNFVQPFTPVTLVDKETLGVLEKLSLLKAPLICLTSRAAYEVDHTEKQLHSVNIDFAQSFPFSQLELPHFSLYKSGVLYCGNNKISEVLLNFFNEIHAKPQKIVLIDAKWEIIREIEKVLKQTDIKFIGIRFSGADAKALRFDPALADLQWSFLPKIIPTSEALQMLSSDSITLHHYFENYLPLCKAENWKQIILQGKKALEIAKKQGLIQEEAKICAHLTSTFFYQGNYAQALIYAEHCHELAEMFPDVSLYLHALYLESAIYRALGGKEARFFEQQELFNQAVEIGELALNIYHTKKIENIKLKGKVLLTIGAAHADNPIGNLDQALSYYLQAIDCFKISDSKEDIPRCLIRLAKVHLLKNEMEEVSRVIEKIRLHPLPKRIEMHLEYLESLWNLELHTYDIAFKKAEAGLSKAQQLGAKEDARRFTSLLENITISQRKSKPSGSISEK